MTFAHNSIHRFISPTFSALVVLASLLIAVENKADDKAKATSRRVVVMSPAQATEQQIADWKGRGYQIAIAVEEKNEATKTAVARVKKQTGQIQYLFEVARNKEIAEAHPEWMASIQGHHEWMQHVQGARKPAKDEIVKVFPWVPVFNREPLDAHVRRIEQLLNGLPEPHRIWLNDIQGAPSACGCGHPLCRWTSDYGPINTATPIGDPAPAEFVSRIKKLCPKADIIPIMTSECEAEDQHTVCGGVGCFKGICWKAFTRQLDMLSPKCPEIGVACFYKTFDRDLPRYKEKAGWIRYAMLSFEKMPKARNGKGVKVARLHAVLQGWDVTAEELQQQILVAERLKPAGILICLSKVDQSWMPKILKTEKTKKASK